MLALPRGPGRRGRPQVLEQALKRGPRIASEPERLRVVAAELIGVDVDLHDLLLGPGRREREARPDGEDDVGREQMAPERALPGEGRAERDLALVAHRALAFGALDDAGLEIVGHGGDRLVRTR